MEGSLSEVENSPPHNLDTPHRMVAGNTHTYTHTHTGRTRKMVIVVSRQTIQVCKAWRLPNITHAGIYESNDMDTCTDTCYAGANWKLVSLFNDV